MRSDFINNAWAVFNIFSCLRQVDKQSTSNAAFNFRNVTVDEVRKLLLQVKTSKLGIDSFPPKLVKDAAHINKSFGTSTFPNRGKLERFQQLSNQDTKRASTITEQYLFYEHSFKNDRTSYLQSTYWLPKREFVTISTQQFGFRRRSLQA